MLVLNHVKQGDRRLRWLAAGVLLGMCILLSGVWYIQIVTREKYQTSLKAQSFRNVRMPASRGKILDRQGKVLADNEPRFNVNLYLEDIRSKFIFEYTNTAVKQFIAREGRRPKTASEKRLLSESARYQAVSNIVREVSTAVLGQELVLNSNAFKRHYNEKLVLPLPILSGLDSRQVAMFMERSIQIPGVELEVEPFRYYPHGGLAAHLLGYVQYKELAQDEEGPTFRYGTRDYFGQTGVEAGYDEDLRGAAGAKAVLVNNLGYRQTEQTWIDPDPGRNIVLTLDLELQKAVESALVGGDPDTRGAAVVLDCQTGDVLAVASAPTYDANMFVRPRDFSSDDWKRVNDEVLAPQHNRALRGAYHPGSIFKMIVGLAGFEAGIMGPNDKIEVPPDQVYRIGRRTIRDTAPPGFYDFKKAMKHSSNCYFIHYGLMAGVNRLLEMGRRFGLGERTGAVPPGQESAGYFPEVGEREKKNGNRWMEGDTANLCIGQGEITVTPLQMAVMTAALANGGKLLKPRLVVQLEDQRPGGGIEPLAEPHITRDLNLNRQHLAWVREGMLADVEDRDGTGHPAYISGMDIAGKTGTAQVRMAGGRMDHITWFVSFAPFHAPRYAVVVMIESGASGGGTCAPKAKLIYQAIQKMELVQRNKRLAQSGANGPGNPYN